MPGKRRGAHKVAPELDHAVTGAPQDTAAGGGIAGGPAAGAPGGAAGATVTLYPLTFVAEGDDVIIGRPEIDSFAVFPADGAEVVRRLAAGEDPAAAAAWYEQTYGEPADIGDFLDTLAELEFIRPPGVPLPGPLPPVRWRCLAAVLLSWPALTVYAAATVAAVALMIAVPALRPVPSQLFFSRSLLLVFAVGATAQLAGLLLHEGAHVLAGRRLGLRSRLRVGRRLYFVVAETTLVGLMGVPSRKRILPFCAGLIADAVVISVATGVAEAGRLAGWSPIAVRITVVVAWVTLIRMIWQFMLFMETDLCHVLAAALRCPDLHAMSRSYLGQQARRLRDRAWPARAPAAGAQDGDDDGWTDRDRRVVRRFAPFVLAGSVVIIGAAAATTIPAVTGIAERIYHGVATGQASGEQFWDSLAVGSVITANFIVIGIMLARSRRQRRAALAAAALVAAAASAAP
jgi:hypothetical protein